MALKNVYTGSNITDAKSSTADAAAVATGDGGICVSIYGFVCQICKVDFICSDWFWLISMEGEKSIKVCRFCRQVLRKRLTQVTYWNTTQYWISISILYLLSFALY